MPLTTRCPLAFLLVSLGIGLVAVQGLSAAEEEEGGEEEIEP